MPSISLKAILNRKSGTHPTFRSLLASMGMDVCILDAAESPLLGSPSSASDSELARQPVLIEDALLGYVLGPIDQAKAVAALLGQLGAREAESRSLAAEVLHLYRELHLIEQLSEQLARVLDVSAVAHSALVQAQRLITASYGSILVLDRANGGATLTEAASFGKAAGNTKALGLDSQFAALIAEKGVAEIVNDCGCDPRISGSEIELKALICAPLRAGQRTIGTISLASNLEGASYSSADLKLLNTIALQTAAAMENSLLCAEMVQAARERAALTAELQAASTVQQMLLQNDARATPGFQVDSVYLPASEVGGDFYFTYLAPDGSLIAIVGDVSGKGLTAAMRVALILGALRRETSDQPDEILFGLNNVLIARGQIGFTTALCIRISPAGNYTLANAGHISPYVAGRELEAIPALPLGLVHDNAYTTVQGKLNPEERVVLLSDGVPEARSATGELYGFQRLSSLTSMPACEIAETAQRFGQEDDITVLTIILAPEVN